MGSVLDIIECPNCNQEASIDFYYKTGEEEVFCTHCGYRKSTYIQNRDKALNELTDDDWVKAETKHPYGCAKLKIKDTVGYSLSTLESSADYKEFVEYVSSNIDDIEFASVSRFVNNEILLEIIKNQ